jgi:hypothetical protein
MSNNTDQNNQAIFTALKLLNIVEVNINISKYGDKALINSDLIGEDRIEVIHLYGVRRNTETKYRLNTFVPPEDDNIEAIFELISQLDFS